jgi:hypothetical protein
MHEPMNIKLILSNCQLTDPIGPYGQSDEHGTTETVSLGFLVAPIFMLWN